MSQTMNATIDGLTATNIGLGRRLLVLGYGVFAYGIGVGSLMWLILTMSGLAPVGLSAFKADSASTAVGINLVLIVLFGIQHSVMARAGFKQRLKKILPEAAERATYLLASGVVTVIAIYFWQPIPGLVWQLENPAVVIGLWALHALAWAYLFIATFVTNHFELMGLRQAYLYFTQQPYTKLPFTNKLMYRYSRHPMMLGFLVGMWAVPTMSVTHFAMASLFTVYIAAGVALEERDLVRQFGDTYREYKKRIATLVPGIY